MTMDRPNESKADFVTRVAKLLPAAVPLQLRQRLAAQAFDLASMPERADTDSALANEARAITKDAWDLTNRVDRWFGSIGTAALDTSMAEAELSGPLFDDGGKLTEAERRLALSGTDRFALRTVLLGLQVHVGGIASRLSKKGERPHWRAHALRAIAKAAFTAKAERDGAPRQSRRNSKKAGDWWAASVRNELERVLLEEFAALMEARSEAPRIYNVRT